MFSLGVFARRLRRERQCIDQEKAGTPDLDCRCAKKIRRFRVTFCLKRGNKKMNANARGGQSPGVAAKLESLHLSHQQQHETDHPSHTGSHYRSRPPDRQVRSECPLHSNGGLQPLEGGTLAGRPRHPPPNAPGKPPRIYWSTRRSWTQLPHGHRPAVAVLLSLDLQMIESADTGG